MPNVSRTGRRGRSPQEHSTSNRDVTRWLACVATVITVSACHSAGAPGAAPHPRIKEAEAAARQAIAAEAQLRPDTLSVQTVGVLPFDQSGLDSSLSSIGYGLADLLRVDLSKSRQLRIVDRIRLDAIVRELQLAASGRADSSVAPRVGRLAQARRMVYGAVDARGSTMGVSVGVADAATRQVQPAASAEMRLDAILDTEKQLALRVFESMGIALTPAERAAVDERPTKNIAAFIAYGRAVRYETDFRFVDAVSQYREALRLDPTFALAEARLEEIAPLAGLGSRRNALARATDFTVDRVNGLFTSPLGGAQPPGGITDPAFPALTITIFITIITPR